MQNHIIVHYGELRLKGKNRYKFEDKLISNIRSICGGKVERLSSSLLCRNSEIENFRNISGISWYASCIKLSKSFNLLINYFDKINKTLYKNKKSFAVRVKRSDKNFEYDSNRIANEIGNIIRTKSGLVVNLKSPDITIYIEINEYILIYYEKIKGIGGFPAGIHGKVLCLLSGGIDSPVAAYEIIRKGCKVDLLHFHSYTKNEEIQKTKIYRIAELLNRYQIDTRLLVIPSYIIDINILNNKNTSGYEMILFRKFIVLIAQQLALKYGYQAIVTGDSLGQVASQTLENLNAVYDGINLQVLQPLISLDKQEIINKSKIIGSYQISIEPYKDCCSIISDKPITKSDSDKVKAIENQINMNDLLELSIKEISIYNL